MVRGFASARSPLRSSPWNRPSALAAGLLLAVACSHTQAPPPKPPPAPLEFLGEWGVQGSGPSKLDSPVAITTDPAGMLYVSDAGSRFIHKFDLQGTPHLAFQQDGLRAPAGVTVDLGGALYVTDFKGGHVFIFLPDGRLLREMGPGPKRRFESPSDVAVDPDGNIYVCEFGGDKIDKFNARGRLLKSWGKKGGGPGDFNGPTIVVAGPDGFLYVADTGNNRIQRFTLDGEVTAWTMAEGPNSKLDFPIALAVSDKNVFVLDAYKPELLVWTLAGQFVLSDDLGGRLMPPMHQKFPSPAALAYGPGKQLIVLTPSLGGRILRFRLNL